MTEDSFAVAFTMRKCFVLMLIPYDFFHVCSIYSCNSSSPRVRSVSTIARYHVSKRRDTRRQVHFLKSYPGTPCDSFLLAHFLLGNLPGLRDGMKGSKTHGEAHGRRWVVITAELHLTALTTWLTVDQRPAQLGMLVIMDGRRFRSSLAVA